MQPRDKDEKDQTDIIAYISLRLLAERHKHLGPKVARLFEEVKKIENYEKLMDKAVSDLVASKGESPAASAGEETTAAPKKKPASSKDSKEHLTTSSLPQVIQAKIQKWHQLQRLWI